MRFADRARGEDAHIARRSTKKTNSGLPLPPAPVVAVITFRRGRFRRAKPRLLVVRAGRLVVRDGRGHELEAHPVPALAVRLTPSGGIEARSLQGSFVLDGLGPEDRVPPDVGAQLEEVLAAGTGRPPKVAGPLRAGAGSGRLLHDVLVAHGATPV